MQCDLDQPSVYTQTAPHSKIERICDDCGGRIKVGEVYHRIWGVWRNKPDSYQWCADCQHMRCEITDENHYDGCGVALGGLREEINERSEDHPEWVAAFNAYSEFRESKRPPIKVR